MMVVVAVMALIIGVCIGMVIDFKWEAYFKYKLELEKYQHDVRLKHIAERELREYMKEGGKDAN